MLQTYILSQSLTYLLTGILIISVGGIIQKSGISCVGDVFIVLGFILGASIFSKKLMSRVVSIDSIFAGLLFECSLLFGLASLVFMLGRNDITPHLVTVLVIIILIYVLMILVYTIVVVKNRTREPDYWRKKISEFKNINKVQMTNQMAGLFVIAFLSAIVSIIVNDGGLVYFVVIDYICALALVIIDCG